MRKHSLLGPGLAFKKCWLTMDLSQWRLAPGASEEPLQLCVSTTLVSTLATGAQRPRCRSRQVHSAARGSAKGRQVPQHPVLGLPSFWRGRRRGQGRKLGPHFLL